MKRNFSVKNRNFTINWVIAILLSLSLILPNIGNVLAVTDSTDNTEAPMLTALNTGEILPAVESIPEEKTYTIELEKYGIKNDGTDPENTSTGINNALKAVSTAVYEKIIFPQGIYLISENTPILISLKNMSIDLNGSTLEINANGKTTYSIFKFDVGAENCTITNGILKGDGAAHNFGTNPNAHVGCVGIFLGGTITIPLKNIQIGQIIFTNFPGNGIQVSASYNNQNISIKDNKFIDNRQDLSILSGIGISIEDNKFVTTENKNMPAANLAAVSIQSATKSYTFKNNNVSSGRVEYLQQGPESNHMISGNTYENIRVDIKPEITITSDIFNNCQVVGTLPASGAQRGKLVGCTLKRDTTTINAVTNVDLENCTITPFKGQMKDVNLANCTISAAELDLTGQPNIQGGTITDSTFKITTANTIANFNGSTIQNSQISYLNPTDLTVENCTITTSEKSVVLVSNNTKSLNFKNNTVDNQSSNPVFQVSTAAFADTTNCTVVLESNNFTLIGASYVFDGTNITKGKLTYTGRNNTVTGGEILNPQYYTDNPNVTIIEKDTPTFTTLDLSKYDTDANGLSPEETSTGINAELKKASEDGYKKVILPQSTYVISESKPITIDISNMVIDLNGSTLQINKNVLDSYSIIEFVDGAENNRLTNGIIEGDREATTPINRKYGHGIVLKGGQKNQIDHITVTNATGNGIRIESGTDIQINNCTFKDNGNIQETAAPVFAVDFAIVEDKSIQNVTLSDNKFITNAHDLAVRTGTNLIITGNELTNPGNVSGRSAVRFMGKETKITFKFTGNKISNGNVVYELKEVEDCEVSGNEYKDINVISTRLPVDSIITLTNEKFENCALRPGTNTYNEDGTIKLNTAATDKICVRLVNCTFTSNRADTNALYDAELENCTIGPLSGETVVRGVNFKGGTIVDASLKLLRQLKFEGTEITNSYFLVSTNNPNPSTTVELDNCNITDSRIEYDKMSTNPTDVMVMNSDIIMNGDNAESLVKLSTRANGLIFKNNTVANESAKSVFYASDFTAATNCTLVLESNSFTNANSKYVFDGMNITAGKLTYTGKGNTVTGAAEMLNPQYIGKENVVITERDAVTPSTITIINNPVVVKVGKPVELAVNLKDKADDNIPGEQINWSVASGIGNGTFSTASSPTDATGNATVTFTPAAVTEADKVTVLAAVNRVPSLSCTIELFADEIIQINPVAVITEAGTAPILPEKVTAITKNKREMQVNVTWNVIDPAKYAQKGSFTVEGTVEDTDVKALANVRVKVKNTAVTTLEGPEIVANGEQIELILGLTGVVEITDLDISISYDKSEFEFVDAVPVTDGITVEKTHSPEEGTIGLKITSTAAISGTAEVVKLSFNAKATGTGEFCVTKAELSDGLDKFIAALSNMTITVTASEQELSAAIVSAKEVLNQAVEGIEIGMYPEGTKARLNSAIVKAAEIISNMPEEGFTKAVEELKQAVDLFKSYVITAKTGDFNRISGLDIGDLGMVSVSYGIKAEDEGWNAVKRFDINGDGVIGDFELTFIAKKLLAK